MNQQKTKKSYDLNHSFDQVIKRNSNMFKINEKYTTNSE